ncbi:MAG: hypothetical protein KA297_06050 [Kofleriaceae bacterium]|nr:hypothetical protein [Kofleriaceae bacterium]
MDPRPPLRREVQEPGPGPAARGLVAVSATAMMLALTSSTLLFWASLPGGRGPSWQATAEPLVVSPWPAAGRAAPPAAVVAPAAPCRQVPARSLAPAPAQCGAPVYRSLGDGRTEVEFEACAGVHADRR